MLISEFFADQEIFITGGTGFIGKALIEKLLRSCSKLKNIYVLIRGKKNVNINERLDRLLNDVVFKQLRKENEKLFTKIIAIEGDCSQIGLGISPEDLRKIQNVSMVFHSAASVRFEDPIKDAILLNTRGTFELIKIAETLKSLKALVHVSTCYCTGGKNVIEEKVYKPPVDWRKAIKIAETFDGDILNILNLQYGCHQVNTYTFTKSLSEQLVADYKDKLPITIFRPSIVVSAIKEPIPGWVDNMNGPIGLLIACGSGILRTHYTSGEILFSVVPIDVVIRSMIIAAFKLGSRSINHEKQKELEVYNCTIDKISPITLKRFIEVGKTMVRQNPFENMMWAPGGQISKCPVIFLFRFLFTQMLLSFFLDCVIWAAGKKTMLMKLQRKIEYSFTSLSPFIENEWDFKVDNFFALDQLVSDSERETFGFFEISHIDLPQFFKDTTSCTKLVLLKEQPESSPGARLRLKIFLLIEYIFKSLFIIYALWFLYRRLFI